MRKTLIPLPFNNKLSFTLNHALCCFQDVLFFVIKTEPWNKKKYERVKESHMLARIGCYCKIMLFSPFKLEVTYCHSFKGNK